jgi:hypothetical protein
MPVKTSVKKITKAAKKLAKKAPQKVTWDDIEAGFDRLQKLHEETEKTLKKSQDEAWAAIRETQQAHKETEKAIKETQKNIGGLNNSLGSMVEHILTPNLPQEFKKIGYSFNRIASYKFAEGVFAQIDGMLENGTQAIAVEVKFTLRLSDIDDHLLRMDKIRKFADEHGDKRHFMGAMAAINTDEPTKKYALKNGLFVIEPRGEDVKVTKPAQEPRVW